MNTVLAIQDPPIPFDYAGSPIRVVTIDGEPWFCAPDVCAVLGHGNTSKALKDHCKAHGLTKRSAIDTLGRMRETNFVNEGNLYRLILRSKTAEAEPFELWVMETVLPAVRKTGRYVVKRETDPVLMQLEAIALMRREQLQIDARLTLVENTMAHAREAIDALPPALEVRDFTTRESCRLAVDSLVSLTGRSHHDIWHEAYRQYDVLQRTCLTKVIKGQSKIEYVEKTGGLDVLYGIIVKMTERAKS